MLLEFMKLGVGLAIALFHQPLADYILEQERALVVLLRQRGLGVPGSLTQRSARNIYFVLGIFVASAQIIRIWMILHGN
jgi:hypothetical protein